MHKLGQRRHSQSAKPKDHTQFCAQKRALRRLGGGNESFGYIGNTDICARQLCVVLPYRYFPETLSNTALRRFFRT